MRKKSEPDIINGSLKKLIPLYALPIALTGILGQFFNAADIMVVGNFTGDLGTAAVAAVGANSSIISLILNLFIGISLGANVVIANAVGRGDKKTVQHAVHTSIIAAIAGGLFAAIFGEIFAAQILNMLHVPQDVFDLSLLYLRIYLAGLPVILLYNFEAAFFRSIGETKTPLIALAISGVLNIILNLFFVLACKMTVDGVATATVISNAVSAVILFIKLMKTDTPIRINIKKLHFDKTVFAKILKIGVPAGVQSAVFAMANIIIQSAINSLGTIVIAASSAASNIETFVYYIFNSFSQACTTFVGQNYGAKKVSRCKKVLYISFIEDAAASFATICIVLLTGKFLISVFDSNPEVIETGYIRLVMILSAYIFSMIYEVISGYLRGFGISLAPAILTTIGVCGTRLFWIYSVFPKNRTFGTIMMVYPISLSVTALLIFIALIIYRPSKRYADNKKTKQ